MQLWVFVRGPVNGRALEVSLGFSLMQLTFVLIGWLMFRERLTSPQLAAALIAGAGVANELNRVGEISWVMLLVAVGYPTCFTMRRKMRIDH